MIKTIFHGSDHVVDQPVFHGGRPNNDYGHGFYCTEYCDLAKEWAVSREHDGFANAYQLDLIGLSILNLNREHPLISWLAVLLANRTFALDSPLSQEAHSYILREFAADLSPYDIVIGYRADDSYFSFAQDFLNNTISYEQLSYAMHLGHLGEQFVIKSKKAYARLQFLEAFPVSRKEYLARKELRDQTVQNAYFHSDRIGYHRGELYVTEILDKEMKKNDPRLR